MSTDDKLKELDRLLDKAIDAYRVASENPNTVFGIVLNLILAQEKLKSIEETLANHPRACDHHDDDDPVSCGWKRVVLDIEHTLGVDSSS